jgi:AraC-like DNA-binding protein
MATFYDEGHSLSQVARRFGLNPTTCFALFKSFGHTRESYRTLKSQTFTNVNLDLSFLDGWLLGDGCAKGVYGHNRNARLRHESSKLSYTLYIREQFNKMGFSSSKVYKRNFKDSRISFYVESNRHPKITEQMRRWYPEGIKRVPRDLNLDAFALLQWFLGDGCVNCGSPVILSCFPEEDISFLWESLKCLLPHWILSHYKAHNTDIVVWVFRYPKRFREEFYATIGSCPVVDYHYKWV